MQHYGECSIYMLRFGEKRESLILVVVRDVTLNMPKWGGYCSLMRLQHST